MRVMNPERIQNYAHAKTGGKGKCSHFQTAQWEDCLCKHPRLEHVCVPVPGVWLGSGSPHALRLGE